MLPRKKKPPISASDLDFLKLQAKALDTLRQREPAANAVAFLKFLEQSGENDAFAALAIHAAMIMRVAMEGTREEWAALKAQLVARMRELVQGVAAASGGNGGGVAPGGTVGGGAG